jgi:hypothetical protein
MKTNQDTFVWRYLKTVGTPCLLGFMVGAGSLGCSGQDAGGTSIESRIGQVESELFGSSAQVTGLTTASQSYGQGETQVAFSYASSTDSIQFVTYNDKSHVDNGDNPLNLFGWSYNDPMHNSGWVNHKLGPPSGFGLIWGDPGIAVNPYSSNRYTYMTNMGMTTNAASCASADCPACKCMDSVCVARFDRTNTSTFNSPNLKCYQLETAAGHGIDGTAITAGGANGAGFFATLADANSNDSHRHIELWASCTNPSNGTTCSATTDFHLAQSPYGFPFSGRDAQSHPRLIADDPHSILYAATVVDGGPPVSLLEFNYSSTSGFQTPVLVASTPGIVADGCPSHCSLTKLPSTGNFASMSLPAPSYSMALGTNSAGVNVLRFAYSYKESDGHYHVRFADCSTWPNVSTPSCTAATAWNTVNYSNPANPSYLHDEVFPQIAFGDGHWKVAYLTSYNADGYLSVGYQSLSEVSGTYQSSPLSIIANTSSQLPGTTTSCDPSGDYQGIAYNKSQPNFIYTYSRQQTGTTCNPDLSEHVWEAAIPYDPTLPPPSGNIVAARQSTAITAVFTVGSDGALYRRWYSTTTGTWQGPSAITGANFAPPGAPLAVGQPPGANELDVFVVDTHGTVQRAFETNDGAWQVAAPLSAANFAVAGAHIATGIQSGVQLDVVIVDKNGTLQGFGKQALGNWSGNIPLANGFAPSGAGLATANHPGANQFDVYAIGTNGSVTSTWALGLGAFTLPVSITAANVASPGAPLATGMQGTTQLDIFYTGATDGAIHGVWFVNGSLPFGPIALTSNGFMPATGNLSTVQVGTNLLGLFAVNNAGASNLLWVVGQGAWNGPATLTANGVAVAGASTSATTQGSNLIDFFTLGNLYLLEAQYTISTSTWSNAVPLVP